MIKVIRQIRKLVFKWKKKPEDREKAFSLKAPPERAGTWPKSPDVGTLDLVEHVCAFSTLEVLMLLNMYVLVLNLRFLHGLPACVRRVLCVVWCVLSGVFCGLCDVV